MAKHTDTERSDEPVSEKPFGIDGNSLRLQKVIVFDKSFCNSDQLKTNTTLRSVRSPAPRGKCLPSNPDFIGIIGGNRQIYPPMVEIDFKVI